MRESMYPTIDMKATGRRIRRIMNQRKLSVKDVQKYLNLSSVQSIYHWLHGQSMPTIDNLYALSELFQLPVDAMLVGNRKYYKSPADEPYYSRIYVYYQMVMECVYN
ncbi:MAG: helix-turn-helix transcriptional regulator [Lachnospiraceae bacterium]|nr:helix-turn-helix transcriptional regulator [Lachnospiraceae bacterium]